MGPKMEVIWLKVENIWLKMEAIWLKMEVVWLLEPPGGRSSQPTEDRWKNGWPPGRPGSPPGTQRHPESTKNCFFAKKKAFQPLIFVDFFAQGCFLRFGRVFSSIFDEKSMKNQRKKQCIFSVQCLFFWAWRPSRNIVFYNAKATFPFFVYLCFF